MEDILSLVVTIDGKFGFVGKPVGQDEYGLTLEDAMTIAYEVTGDASFVTFGHAPVGDINPAFQTRTRIPNNYIGYTIEFEANKESHPLAAKYYKALEECRIPEQVPEIEAKAQENE